jgi:hypothetical protein
MKTSKFAPIPEMLGRKDNNTEGAWTIGDCQPVRGNPYTNIVAQHMVVPVGNEELDRVIRAHEMTHARVSPPDLRPWIDRGIATQQAMVVVEEVRVNYLVKKAGFDTTILADGSETASGMLLAQRGDWKALVYAAVGYSYCGGGKDFLTGVRRVNREWGATLKEITKRVEKELDKAWKTGYLASTEVDHYSGLAPRGFAHVERIAEWVERMATLTDPATHDEDSETNGSGNGEQDNEVDGRGDSKPSSGDPGAKGDKKQDDKPKKRPDVSKINPTNSHRPGAPTWNELQVKHLPLTRIARGGIGYKRVPSQIGKNPRRVLNALTDSQRRVFDRSIRGKGGVVLIDGSGSMSLTSKQILELTEAAPGCTVAVYSAGEENGSDNLWVLAKDGRMVDSLPKRPGGNGVDGHAIRWAIKQRKRSTTPVVWVTDGGVHGKGTGYDDILALDCLKEVVKNRVHMRETVEEGIQLLRDLGAGRTPARWLPYRWKRSYQKVNGRNI